MANNDKQLTYAAALAELEQIQSDLSDSKISVDELTNKVLRANELLKFCQSKLKQTSDKIDDVFESEN